MPSRAKWKKCLQFHPLSYAFLPAVCSFPENLLRFVVGFSFPLGQLSKVTTNLFPSFSIVMRLGVERVRSSSAVFASFGMLDCSSQGLPEAWYFFRALVSRCSRLNSSEGWNCREKYDFQRRKRSRCFEDLPIWPGPQSEGKEISLPFGEMSKGKEK